MSKLTALHPSSIRSGYPTAYIPPLPALAAARVVIWNRPDAEAPAIPAAERVWRGQQKKPETLRFRAPIFSRTSPPAVIPLPAKGTSSALQQVF
jgi:hypothetical protein